MAITAEQRYLLNNKVGATAHKVQLGELIYNAEIGGLADSAVTTGKIADLGVTTGKMAADAIDATKVADDAISLEHLDAGLEMTRRDIHVRHRRSGNIEPKYRFCTVVSSMNFKSASIAKSAQNISTFYNC